MKPLKITIGKRDAKCRHCKIVIKGGSERVELNKYFFGWAHPICALRKYDITIKGMIELRDQYLKDYQVKLVADEL